MASKRFLMVPEDSSAARMPLPGATMPRATLFSASRFIFTPLSVVIPGRRAAANPESSCLNPVLDSGFGLRPPRNDREFSALLYSQHFHPRQGLAFEPFDAGAA